MADLHRSQEAREDLAQRRQLLDALIDVRVRQKLTQYDVADRMGISQPTVAEFEKGLDSRVPTYQRYAQACGVELRMWIEPRLDQQALAEAMLAGFQGGRWIKSQWSDLSARTQAQLLGEAGAVLALLKGQTPT